MVNYPTSLDNDTTLYDVTDNVDVYLAAHHNALKDALIAVETAVGITGAFNFLTDLVGDLSPQLGGDLDLNTKNIDFPTTANISDCKDEDDMASNSATMLATQQSIKAYVDSSPCARAYNNANIAIAYATWTALTFNAERYDNDDIHHGSINTGRLTCKTAGVYSIFATAGFEAIVGGDYHMILRLNGSTILSQKVFPNCIGGHAVGMDLGSQYKLAVNDYVEVQVYWWCSGCSGSKNILYTAEYSPEFMMARIGDG